MKKLYRKREDRIGILVALLGLAGFFVSMSYFDLFEKKIILEKNGLKGLISFSFIIFAAGGIGYHLGKLKGALYTMIGMTVFFVSAFLFGYARGNYS